MKTKMVEGINKTCSNGDRWLARYSNMLDS